MNFCYNEVKEKVEVYPKTDVYNKSEVYTKAQTLPRGSVITTELAVTFKDGWTNYKTINLTTFDFTYKKLQDMGITNIDDWAIYKVYQRNYDEGEIDGWKTEIYSDIESWRYIKTYPYISWFYNSGDVYKKGFSVYCLNPWYGQQPASHKLGIRVVFVKVR